MRQFIVTRLSRHLQLVISSILKRWQTGLTKMVSLAGALASISMSAESPEKEGNYLRTVLQRLLYWQLLYSGHGSGWLFVN